jgi:molybdopterin/thiamine biosynthesis adenylyltransferase
LLADAAIVGCGALGSWTAALLVRALLGRPHPRIVLVDPGRVEDGNLSAQHFGAADVGTYKVSALRKHLQGLHRGLAVAAHSLPVSELPPGQLRAEVVFGCVDSRTGRKDLNRLAVRLGLTLIDLGVDGQKSQARATILLPTHDGPCLECHWSDEDYKLLEEVGRCGNVADTPSTRAPASTAALAAALGLTEYQALRSGKLDPAVAGWEVFLDAGNRTTLYSKLTRNPHCQCDHRRWHVGPLGRLPRATRVKEIFELATANGSEGPPRWQAAGDTFARVVACPRCGQQRTVLRTIASLQRRPVVCGDCGRAMGATQFDAQEWLEPAMLSPRERSLTLKSVGLRPGDMVAVAGLRGPAYFELADDEPRGGACDLPREVPAARAVENHAFCNDEAC